MSLSSILTDNMLNTFILKIRDLGKKGIYLKRQMHIEISNALIVIGVRTV